MKIHRSIEIAASGSKIWPFVVEPENIRKWCAPAKKFERTSEQKSGLGTTFFFEERAAGRLMKLHFMVTEWVPNYHVAFTMTRGNFVKHYEQKYTLEAISSGCRCTCYEDVRMSFGIFGRFVLLFRRRYSKGLLDTMLANLKILAEA
jgi:hypothetical protein